MDIEQRKKIVADKLLTMGDTLTSWANRSGLQQRIITDLIEGTLKGTRGVSLETRLKIEKTFGPIFDD